MNKQILLTLSADELETRIRDITNELNQEWHLDRRMRLSTAKRLQKELAYCQSLLHNPTNKGESYV
jgi:ABC-type Na+ transport system ATPase subunit NatA